MNCLGIFIVFEGLDGSGKSVQARMFKEYLEKHGHEVVARHEPTYESAPGKKIKEALTHTIKLPPRELQMLYVADRRWNTDTFILPALRDGKTVIADRYALSTIAYGSLAVPMEELITMNAEFPQADLTIILKVRPEICLARLNKRQEGLELFDKVEKMEKIWKTYETLPVKCPHIFIVNGEKAPEKVHEQIVALSAGKI